jgi:hypothetical protein
MMSASIATDTWSNAAASTAPKHSSLERLKQVFAEFADPVPALVSALGASTDIHVSPIEEVSLDSWGAWAHRAHRRRGARHVTEHGTRRGDGTRRCACPHRVPATNPGDPGRARGVRGPAPTQNRLGADANPPTRPHSVPAPDRQRPRPAGARTTDFHANYRPLLDEHEVRSEPRAF